MCSAVCNCSETIILWWWISSGFAFVALLLGAVSKLHWHIDLVVCVYLFSHLHAHLYLYRTVNYFKYIRARYNINALFLVIWRNGGPCWHWEYKPLAANWIHYRYCIRKWTVTEHSTDAEKSTLSYILICMHEISIVTLARRKSKLCCHIRFLIKLT
jgi:hypothetical protein